MMQSKTLSLSKPTTTTQWIAQVAL